jgi:branched-chain amino acid transport system permease protein
VTATVDRSSEPVALPRPVWGRHLIAVAVLTVLLIPLPLLLGDAQEAVAVRVLIFALLSIGWNVMSGFGGMFSFGHAAFFGLGAYTSVWLLVEQGISPWIGMLVGMVIAALFGVLVGFLALRYRLKGAYFALSTFAFAEMLRLIATNSDLVNRAVGYNVPLRPESSWAYMQFEPGSANYFWIALGLTVLALVASILFLRSRTGRFAVAIRDDEEAAASLGVSVMRSKLLTIALSAAISSLAGAFYVEYYFFIDPDGAFGASVSIQAILPAVIGGVATIWGPVIGSVILGPLNDVTASLLRNPPPALDFLQGRAGLDVIVYAILLILIVLLLPQGVYGAIRDRRRRRRCPCSRSRTSASPSGACARSGTSRSPSRRAASSASSARTAPARRRCST